MAKKSDVTFIRKGGKVIPIRKKKGSKNIDKRHVTTKDLALHASKLKPDYKGAFKGGVTAAALGGLGGLALRGKRGAGIGAALGAFFGSAVGSTRVVTKQDVANSLKKRSIRKRRRK